MILHQPTDELSQKTKKAHQMFMTYISDLTPYILRVWEAQRNRIVFFYSCQAIGIDDVTKSECAFGPTFLILYAFKKRYKRPSPSVVVYNVSSLEKPDRFYREYSKMTFVANGGIMFFYRKSRKQCQHRQEYTWFPSCFHQAGHRLCVCYWAFFFKSISFD